MVENNQNMPEDGDENMIIFISFPRIHQNQVWHDLF